VIFLFIRRHLALDYTATTILSKFQNDTAGRSVERVLEKLSKKKAAEILAVGSFAPSYYEHILTS